ncbi:hypothetical protein BGZ80_006621 [Entomortierella chlamydospora]|uniref:J domain-containing protein n=1 Tax=Entomortierella chlamydospora TaxID=101097 RepID=A0A9P6MYS3_9FUNG|nr:hypothetical protein BGZ80_006621 [Entomortierella chlamydospora]
MTSFHCCQSYTRLLAQAARRQSVRQTLFGSTASVSKTANTASFHTSTYSQSGKRNHYEQLNLARNATKKEIKSQFYKLSKLHHPDKNASEESHKKFLLINEAYSVLGDERKRRDYDLTQLDKSGTLYSDSSSYSPPTRGTLRRTPFRHSPQSAAAAAAAAAAARSRAPFRPNFGEGVSHFDSKSHQQMHYAQEIKREKRRQARERASPGYQEQKRYEESETSAGRILRVLFVFMAVVAVTSFMKTFADEGDDQEHGDLDDDLMYITELYEHE